MKATQLVTGRACLTGIELGTGSLLSIPKTRQLVPSCTLLIPVGVLCRQIPGDARAVRDASSRPHQRRQGRLGPRRKLEPVETFHNESRRADCDADET
jgi:hypothetical protein